MKQGGGKGTNTPANNGLTDTENSLLVAKGEGRREEMDREFQVSRCEL